MERLAEQIVDWHNRHPLARRITVGDVHTIGVVALPFVRASAQAGGFVEPVLTDAVSAFDEMETAPKPSPLNHWRRRLAALAARLPGTKPRTQWRAFNEKFLPGLSPARVERFALAHGYADAPATPETRPWRVIVIDERLSNAHSGWPFEIFLMSAAIEVGGARTRVLTGRGIPSQIIGRRLWDPVRLGAAAALLALLAGGAAYALWPHAAPAPAEEAPAPAASSAAPIAAPPPPAEAASMPAPTTAQAASAAEGVAPASPASDAASEAGDAASQPDIRPHLVQRTDGIVRPPLRSSKPAASAADAAPGQATEPSGEQRVEPPARQPAAAASQPAAAGPKAAEAPDTRLPHGAATPGKLAVALVGPAGSKADAQALLKKMQAALGGVHSNPDALQGDVIQTPEGWRATVWPFRSREQAQLINATLVARGYKTKAVNF